jgi:hypothetical protein
VRVRLMGRRIAWLIPLLLTAVGLVAGMAGVGEREFYQAPR